MRFGTAVHHGATEPHSASNAVMHNLQERRRASTADPASYWRSCRAEPPCRIGLLTLSQVANRLQVSRWTVYQLIWTEELPSVHLGRCHRIRTKDFGDYIERLDGGAA